MRRTLPAERRCRFGGGRDYGDGLLTGGLSGTRSGVLGDSPGRRIAALLRHTVGSITISEISTTSRQCFVHRKSYKQRGIRPSKCNTFQESRSQLFSQDAVGTRSADIAPTLIPLLFMRGLGVSETIWARLKFSQHDSASLALSKILISALYILLQARSWTSKVIAC